MGYERQGPRDYSRENRRDHARDHEERGYRGDSRYGRDDYRGRDDARGRDESRGAPPRDYHEEDRGFFDRAGDEVRSWFGDEEAERRRRWDERLARREYDRRYGPGAYDERYASSMYFAADPMFGGYYPGFDGGYGPPPAAGRRRDQGQEDRWGHDPHYSHWRRQQVEALDRDYDEYRRENQQRFESDFGSWRSTRENQRSALKQAQENQEVVGSDGVHVGKVDHVRGDRILLAKNDRDAGGRHHSIPVSWIVSVDDKVTINRTAAQAHAAWKDEEDSTGPHNLNRAFPGTY